MEGAMAQHTQKGSQQLFVHIIMLEIH